MAGPAADRADGDIFENEARARGRKLFESDRALRDARPDDRIVMEELILTRTAA